MTPQPPPASMYRTTEGLGLWEHRGQAAAVGVGHSPTARRWDGRPETSVGAWSILALRRAGVSPDQIDGLVLDPVTTMMLPEVMAAFAAEVYCHIGDREDLDKKYARDAGSEFLWPEEAILQPWFL